MNEEEQLTYDRWLKYENDRILELEYSSRKAREEGLAEGRAEGRAEGQIEGAITEAWKIAGRMKAKGTGLEEISEITGISVQELQERF